MNDKGEIYCKWALSAAYSRNKKDRVIEVPEVYCQSLEFYLDWYEQQNIPAKFRYNLSTYRGFSEYGPALLNERLSEFAMSERTVKSGIKKQPTNL